MDTMERDRRIRFAATALVAVCASSISAAPQPQELEALMTRVGERVAEYYRRAQSVICVEQSTVQPIQSNWTPDGFSRTVESDLRVESDRRPTATRYRHESDSGTFVASTGGRRASGTRRTAPAARIPTPCRQPLAFLLPAHRDEYRFTSLRNGRERDRAALIIDFMSANRTSRPELVEDERGHDDCFDWSGPVATRGRVWVDAKTHEVLRVDRRIDGPVDVRVPWKLQRRYHLPAWVVIERDDLTMRYTAVAFSDPDEVVLLPESIESLTVVRSGLQSIRRTDTFSSYRRFLTAGRVIKAP